MNAQQTVLKFLADLPNETFTVETISRQTNIGYHTARRALTKLRNVRYVQVTNGNWNITPEGKEKQETNPNFSLDFLVGSPQNGSRENWAELLGPETINSSFSRVLLQEPPREALEKVLPYLRFFTLAWLVAEGFTVNYNAFEEILEATEISSVVVNILNNLEQIENK